MLCSKSEFSCWCDGLPQSESGLDTFSQLWACMLKGDMFFFVVPNGLMDWSCILGMPKQFLTPLDVLVNWVIGEVRDFFSGQYVYLLVEKTDGGCIVDTWKCLIGSWGLFSSSGYWQSNVEYFDQASSRIYFN